MRTRPLSVRTLPIFTTLAAALLTAGCTSVSAVVQAQPSSPSSRSAPTAVSQSPAGLPPCKAPEPAQLPHADGSLTEADSGAYCLAAGQILDVFLTVPSKAAPGTRWSRISVGDVSVVRYGNSGVLTPPVGVTAGVFVGAGRGVTTLSSTLPNGTKWTVTLVIK